MEVATLPNGWFFSAVLDLASPFPDGLHTSDLHSDFLHICEPLEKLLAPFGRILWLVGGFVAICTILLKMPSLNFVDPLAGVPRLPHNCFICFDFSCLSLTLHVTL